MVKIFSNKKKASSYFVFICERMDENRKVGIIPFLIKKKKNYFRST